jgi:hypothetical protein
MQPADSVYVCIQPHRLREFMMPRDRTVEFAALTFMVVLVAVIAYAAMLS